MFYNLIKLLVIQHEKVLKFQVYNQSDNADFEKLSTNKNTFNAKYF